MRPRIVCHMMSSVDGRLLFDRWTPPARGVPEVAAGRYEELGRRFHADGWIVGRTTMQEMAGGRGRRRFAKVARLPRQTFIVPGGRGQVAVAFDPGGKVRYARPTVGGDRVVAVLGEGVPDGYLAELRDRGISYLFAGPDGRDLRRALQVLGREFALKTLLLEGGGGINGSFLKAGLIDEISLIIYPGIDGLSGVPSVFEYAGRAGEKPAAGRALRHLATQTLKGGAVWLRYAVEPVRRRR